MRMDSATREIVACTVIRHLPFGLLVDLTGDQKGIIRVRETSWDAAQRASWKRQFPVGAKLKACVLNRPEGKYVELSLRLVEEDPWDHVLERFSEGQMVDGVVTGVKHYGAFIEIEPGLTGLLHQSRLPAWCKKDVLNLFWPGDRVKVQILKIDCTGKQLTLGSVRTNFADPDNAARLAPRLDQGLPFEQLLQRENRRFILLVEDDTEQGKEIENWMNNLGQRVRWVVSAEEGLAQMEKEPPDLLIADTGLPGMSGVDFIRVVRERWPQVRCTLTTSWTRVEGFFQAIDEMQRSGVMVLFKPLLPDDLLALLLEEGDGEGSLQGDEGSRLDLAEAPLPDLQRSTFQGGLRKLLHRCAQETEFEMVVLFRLDPVHRLVDIVQQYGDITVVQPFMDDLIYSPVRDVAEDSDMVRVENVDDGKQDARFRYLLQAYPFTACLGVKIPNKLVDEYALFLFHARAREIFDDEVAYAQATALAIGSLLERKTLTDQLRATQKMTMLGHLSSYLAHELNHGLSPLNTSIRNLSLELEHIAAASRQSPEKLEHELAFAQDMLKDVRRSVSGLTNTVRAFRDLLSVGKKQIVNMDELVMETLNMLQQTSTVSNVRLNFQPGESLTAIRSQMPLLQHVLLNLMMNAIEQISETRPAEGGQVRIRVEKITKESDDGRSRSDLLRLLVEDDGPGIHWRLWEKIFEAGFTTREDGSGLGLFISRNIMESLGGRLYVLESWINNGTSFAIELPYQL